MNGCVAETVAARVRNSLQELLGPDLAAIWRYGASVFGHPLIDIDLHILVRRQLTTEEWHAVKRLHEELAQETALGLDGLDFWYILLNDAHQGAKPKHLAPWCKGLIDRHWALHRAHWLAGRCEVVYGLEPSSVVPPPTWEELKITLAEELNEAEPGAYWVLQLCRVWASLATRDVVRSKLDSGSWALERLPSEHHAVIHAALHHYERKAEPDDEALIEAYFSEFHQAIRRRVGQIGI